MNLSSIFKNVLKKQNVDSRQNYRYLTNITNFYQSPKILKPVDADTGSGGKPSAHLIVVMAPIATEDKQLEFQKPQLYTHETVQNR